MYNKKHVFAAACFGMLIFGIGLITLGSIAPNLNQKFSLNEIATGTLFSILPVGILIGSLIFGPVCDRYGYKLLLIISCIGMFIGFESIAFAPSLVILQIAIFIFGISGGAINGATNAVVADISSVSKGANLSLLGVFFGIGALGMPLVLGILKNVFTFDQIIAAVGIVTLLIGIYYSFIKFPLSKKDQGYVQIKNPSLLKETVLILIGFFLFCQSSFEAILNNWTTTYLTRHLTISESVALYGLTLFVAGLTAMRLLIGSVFRKINPEKILLISFVIIFSGLLLLYFATTFTIAVCGLIALGAGLAGGFPIMFGFVGDLYAERSGSAFSFILTVALLGNMLVNYLFGIIAQQYGIHHLTTIAFLELFIMVLLSVFIFRRIHVQKTQISGVNVGT
jgi:MFS family permease